MEEYSWVINNPAFYDFFKEEIDKMQLQEKIAAENAEMTQMFVMWQKFLWN